MSERPNGYMPTFPEWIAQHATWLDQLRCRLFGHHVPRRNGFSFDEAEDRKLAAAHNFCWRCGARPATPEPKKGEP